MLKYKTLETTLKEFLDISIFQTDINGKILQTIFTKRDLKKVEKVEEIFHKDEEIKLYQMLLEQTPLSKYLKLNNKDGEDKYAQIQTSEIKDEKRYIFINFDIQGIETSIKEQEYYEKLLEQSEIDPLTKAFNRRGAWKRVKKILLDEDIKRRVGVLFIDIDDLKKVNDTHGHSAGDTAIKQIIDTLFKMARSRDIIMRYGGDEFIMILDEPSTVRSAARGLANRLVDEFSKGKYLTTVSIGVHVFETGKLKKYRDNEKQLINSWCKEVMYADEAAYVSKQKGKCRMTTSPHFDKIYK